MLTREDAFVGDDEEGTGDAEGADDEDEDEDEDEEVEDEESGLLLSLLFALFFSFVEIDAPPAKDFIELLSVVPNTEVPMSFNFMYKVTTLSINTCTVRLTGIMDCGERKCKISVDCSLKWICSV